MKKFLFVLLIITTAANAQQTKISQMPTLGSPSGAYVPVIKSGINYKVLADSFVFSSGASGITSLNGLTGAVQTFSIGTSGTNFNIVSTGTSHTFNFPNASATNRGLLSTTDWSNFNSKQSALGFTPENIANKVVDFDLIDDDKYPSVKAVRAFVLSNLPGQNGNVLDYFGGDYVYHPLSGVNVSAFINNAGYLTTIAGITAGGDLSGTYVNPSVVKLRGSSIPTLATGNLRYNGSAFVFDNTSYQTSLGYTAEDAGNKATSFTTLNNTLYPTTQAVANYTSGYSINFIRTAVKTSNYTASINDLVPVNTTSGSITITLPTAPADKSRVAIKHIIQGGTNTVTVNCAGSDVFNKTGGSTSLTLSLLAQGVILQYDAANAIWTVLADDLPLSQLDLRYAPLTSGTGLLKGNGSGGFSTASAGTDYLAPFGSQTANTFYASPNGSSGVPTFRAIVSADIPTLNQNTTGTAANLSGTPALPNGTTATTQTANDNSTKLSTTAYVATAITNGRPLTATIGSDVTTSSSTMSDVTGMSISIPAAGKWHLRIYAQISCSSASGVKLGLNVTGGTVTLYTGGYILGNLTGSSSNRYLAITAVNGVSTGIYNTIGSSTLAPVTYDVIFATTSSGTVTMRFGSQTNTDVSTVAANSIMELSQDQ